jgi:hypothetical protein
LFLFFCTDIAFDFFASLSLGLRQTKEKISAGLKTLAENFGALQKFWRFMKILALHKNFGASLKFRRFSKILALHENLGAFQKFWCFMKI